MKPGPGPGKNPVSRVFHQPGLGLGPRVFQGRISKNSWVNRFLSSPSPRVSKSQVKKNCNVNKKFPLHYKSPETAVKLASSPQSWNYRVCDPHICYRNPGFPGLSIFIEPLCLVH